MGQVSAYAHLSVSTLFGLIVLNYFPSIWQHIMINISLELHEIIQMVRPPKVNHDVTNYSHSIAHLLYANKTCKMFSSHNNSFEKLPKHLAISPGKFKKIFPLKRQKTCQKSLKPHTRTQKHAKAMIPTVHPSNGQLTKSTSIV